jgi:hypothetical protein
MNRDVVPLWKRGIKGDFRIMLYKSPLTPLFQRGEPIEKPEEPYNLDDCPIFISKLKFIDATP